MDDPSRLRVTVLGEPVLDRYVFGTTERISREAPVLVVREDQLQDRLGGAANVAANVRALGAQVTMVGWVGDDAEGTRLETMLNAAGIDGTLIRQRQGATLSKTRILAGARQTVRQQVLRLDRGDSDPSAESLEQMDTVLQDSLQKSQVLIVSDYGGGQATFAYGEWAQRARAAGCLVVVDSRYALSAYRGVDALTPNQPEAEAALGVELPTASAASEGAEALRRRQDVEAILLTRGPEGLVVVGPREERATWPAVGGPAVDVTGAGDTVTAVAAVARACGATWTEAGRWANLAASEGVQQVGTQVPRSTLFRG